MFLYLYQECQTHFITRARSRVGRFSQAGSGLRYRAVVTAEALVVVVVMAMAVAMTTVATDQVATSHCECNTSGTGPSSSGASEGCMGTALMPPQILPPLPRPWILWQAMSTAGHAPKLYGSAVVCWVGWISSANQNQLTSHMFDTPELYGLSLHLTDQLYYQLCGDFWGAEGTTPTYKILPS